jgi:hypothetical protein
MFIPVRQNDSADQRNLLSSQLFIPQLHNENDANPRSALPWLSRRFIFYLQDNALGIRQAIHGRPRRISPDTMATIAVTYEIGFIPQVL